MAEAPSLWYDLGLNYHQQARLLCSTQGEEEDPSSLSLLLEKAQQVVPSLGEEGEGLPGRVEGGKGGPFCYIKCLENNLFKNIFLSLSV